MRPTFFRCAVLLSMLMVVSPDVLPVFEPVEAEAAPRRRGRRVSRSQANRARAARANQYRRVQARRAQSAARARAQAAARARMTAYARLNQAQANYANRLANALNNPANTPTILNKDYRLQMSEKLRVVSLTPDGKIYAFEDIKVGQTITVTLMSEKVDPKDPTKKTQTTRGQLTGRVTEVSAESLKALTLRVTSYQYGAKNGATTNIPPVPGQFATSILIRNQPSGAAGLFKQ